ncbi:xanthine dehydrogenase accessory factor [Cohaesibacter sp. ES.047]|uniref:xanthine dehydrogenase accessory protein XdhC n=1 Tax=Cohaesibacter sp. ES.047 TaxID=1798205 RepID=UPI000BB88A7E|nr:xanthine dehydrogenase accessory protein XdhC [Cohaesibacter sp. ES.047]SNY90064.1 xanthine dehydrogenase accessory factor [Cohaesibacter sp. ES.047]
MTISLQSFLEKHDTIIRVELMDLKGSSPREIGATIFVTESAIHGTIGGGQLEYIAIDEARRMLRLRQGVKNLSVPLGPEIGQCCGGVVALHFSLMDHRAKRLAIGREDREIATRPNVYIFGAGHVGRALASNLRLLPVHAIVVDSREEELALCDPVVEQRCTPLPEQDVRTAPPGSAFVILTHDHALDFLLAREALSRADAAYVGMIGSKSKRGTFKHWLSGEEGKDAPALYERLTCPIGGSASRDKRPAVIAALTVAEVMLALETAHASYQLSHQRTGGR